MKKDVKGKKNVAKTAAKPGAKKTAAGKTVKKEAAPKVGGAKKAAPKKEAPKKEVPHKPADERNEASGQAAGAARRPQTPIMPQPAFSTFVLSLASSAMVQLGEVPHPDTGASETDLNLARHTIDTIAMLQEKTRDGLTPDEKRLLEGLLYELRMKFVMKK